MLLLNLMKNYKYCGILGLFNTVTRFLNANFTNLRFFISLIVCYYVIMWLSFFDEKVLHWITLCILFFIKLLFVELKQKSSVFKISMNGKRVDYL